MASEADATNPSVDRSGSVTDYDVMISYSHADTDEMMKLRGSLEDAGLKVWVDKNLTVGIDFLNRIGQAIIESKVFISLLSTRTVQSRYCQDELALAYVYEKPIFPVAIEEEKEILSGMDTGMKLQLARYEWYSIMDQDNYHNLCEVLIEGIRTTLEELKQEENAPEVQAQDSTNNEQKGDEKRKRREDWKVKSASLDIDSKSGIRPRSTRPSVNRLHSTSGQGYKVAISNKHAECNQTHNLNTFWDRNFDTEANSVKWETFCKAFLNEYAEEIEKLIGEKNINWMLTTLRRELEVKKNGNSVNKDTYYVFCYCDGILFPFWHRVQEKLVESYAMKEVFNTESSVRMDAIQSLSRFSSAAVVDALFDLLEDEDPNVRAIATISLAKTGCPDKSIPEKLVTSLKDDDRLVRESACIALGYLKNEKVVSHLVEIWRNDTISSVRDAAVAALRKIGGQEAESAIHMTEVLIKEINQLADIVKEQNVK